LPILNHPQGSCNELENPIGIETLLHGLTPTARWSCNELENPIGIETSYNISARVKSDMGCNELENPIGIETVFFCGW